MSVAVTCQHHRQRLPDIGNPSRRAIVSDVEKDGTKVLSKAFKLTWSKSTGQIGPDKAPEKMAKPVKLLRGQRNLAHNWC